MHNIKSCLIVSYGPVPTPQYQKIEGGGMRAWGLAEGLRDNGVDVCVAINNSFPQKIDRHKKIRLTNWGQDQTFVDLMNSYDAVIVSYCMGSDSVFIADHIDGGVQLILDAYVPIYIEVSARDSDNIEEEYVNYMSDIANFNHVLKRGDYFLCANERQKTFYTGVLASLGVINPHSYKKDRILVVPFGINETTPVSKANPYAKLGIKKQDFVVLWFGGIYPWFRIEELLHATKELSKDPQFKFVVVGGKNPFNPNPDFALQYEKLLSFAKENKLLNKSIYLVDWVDFDTRIDWYANADVVISLNQPGSENGFSWRTRVMDYVWGGVAIITNGGDPLSDELAEKGAALRINKLDSKEIIKKVLLVKKNKATLSKVRSRLYEIKKDYFWKGLTEKISSVIESGHKPFVLEEVFKSERNIRLNTHKTTVKNNKFNKAVGFASKSFNYAKTKGIKRSANLALAITKHHVKKRISKRARQFVFIGHHMDYTGAPVVLVQIIEEFAQKYGAKNIRLVATHVDPVMQRHLRELGISVEKAVHAFGWRMIRAQLNLSRDDFVLINTIATYENYRDFIFHELEINNLNHAYWFIHEDKEQIAAIDPNLLRKQNVNRVKNLLSSKKLDIVTPSKRTMGDYNSIFKSNRVKTTPLLVSVPKKYQKKRDISDFETLRFYISGHPGDGRKGQLIAVAAMYDFLSRYGLANPEKYRDFTLSLVSIGNDYLSRQIKWIGGSLLGERLKIFPQVPRDEALKIASSCNVTICCSLNETFGLYVAEGMLMGHALLRDNTAGVDEQLKDGVNGFLIDNSDVHQFADMIEKLLNKETMSTQKLVKMSGSSQTIIAKYGKYSYLDKLKKL